MLDARLKKERVPDVYTRVAPLYDFWGWLTERDARQRCLQLASIRDGEDVLEVAVGTGLAFVKILEANPSGHNEGIDLTPIALNEIEMIGSHTRPLSEALTLLSRAEVDVVSLISRRMKLGDGPALIQAAAQAGVIKVLVDV